MQNQEIRIMGGYPEYHTEENQDKHDYPDYYVTCNQDRSEKADRLWGQPSAFRLLKIRL